MGTALITVKVNIALSCARMALGPSYYFLALLLCLWPQIKTENWIFGDYFTIKTEDVLYNALKPRLYNALKPRIINF